MSPGHARGLVKHAPVVALNAPSFSPHAWHVLARRAWILRGGVDTQFHGGTLARISHQGEWPAVLMAGLHRREARAPVAQPHTA